MPDGTEIAMLDCSDVPEWERDLKSDAQFKDLCTRTSPLTKVAGFHQLMLFNDPSHSDLQVFDYMLQAPF